MVGVLIGSMAGSMSLSFFTNKFGRKRTALVAGGLACVFNGLTCIPVNWVYLFIMRIVTGVPSAMLTTIVPGWLSELATT